MEKNILFVLHTRHPELQGDYDAIQSPNAPIAPNTPNDPNAPNRKISQDVHVGRVLAYYDPVSLRETQKHTYFARIFVRIDVNGTSHTLTMIPQRIQSPTEAIFEDLDTKAAQIRRLKLPEPFRIEDASACVALFPKFRGGKRKTRRRAPTRKTRRR